MIQEVSFFFTLIKEYNNYPPSCLLEKVSAFRVAVQSISRRYVERVRARDIFLPENKMADSYTLPGSDALVEAVQKMWVLRGQKGGQHGP
jgi:hypothetical protein